MRIIEQSEVAKSPSGPCLDAVVAVGHWVAVIDQSTPKRPHEPLLHQAFVEGLTHVASLETLPAAEVVSIISQHVGAAGTEAGPDDSPGPCLTALLLDASARRVIRVGDGHVCIGGTVHAGRSPVDEVLGPMRSLVNHLSDDGADDPGRIHILPWLAAASRGLRNNPTSPYGFGTIDGGTVPAEFVEVFDIPSEETEVSLMTDGYPTAARTLAAAEQLLARALDLMRSGQVDDRTKGLAPGAVSFDDRAFVRVHMEAHA